jgi:hypothetical protein
MFFRENRKSTKQVAISTCPVTAFIGTLGKAERTSRMSRIWSCYNVPAMKAIRYGLHFAILTVAAVIFWLAKDLHLPYWISNFDFFQYALMGALHSTCIVVSLRDHRATHPVIAFPIYALCFIMLVSILSAATPILGLWGSIVWAPLADILGEKHLGGSAIFLTGSAIGASGYWLLVRLFWLKSLRRADWLKTVSLCVTATLLAELALRMFDGYVRGVAKLNAAIISPIFTVAWWFAFSISLYWSEISERANKSTQPVETLT